RRTEPRIGLLDERGLSMDIEIARFGNGGRSRDGGARAGPRRRIRDAVVQADLEEMDFRLDPLAWERESGGPKVEVIVFHLSGPFAGDWECHARSDDPTAVVGRLRTDHVAVAVEFHSDAR